jgi:hypothetical protein
VDQYLAIYILLVTINAWKNCEKVIHFIFYAMKIVARSNEKGRRKHKNETR